MDSGLRRIKETLKTATSSRAEMNDSDRIELLVIRIRRTGRRASGFGRHRAGQVSCHHRRGGGVEQYGLSTTADALPLIDTRLLGWIVRIRGTGAAKTLIGRPHTLMEVS